MIALEVQQELLINFVQKFKEKFLSLLFYKK